MSMNYEQLIGKKCPVCDKNKANIDRIYGVLPCNKCQERRRKWSLEHSEYIGGYPKEGYNRKWIENVNSQRENYRKEMIQPLDSKGRFNPDFEKAHGYNPFKQRKKQEINKPKTKEDQKLDKLAKIIEQQKVKEIEDKIKLQKLPVNKKYG